jgi:hypothetical protein
MSRPKPYARDTKPRDTDSQWKHDLYANTRPSLAARLGGASTSASASASASASSSSRATAAPGASLLNRMSGGKGKELIVMAASGSKLFGFDGTNTNGNGKVKGNGRELLPASGKAARPGRASRQRGVESQLVSKSLGAALADRVGYSGSRSGSGSPGISIMGSAGVRVRVEHLAKGTTVSDLKVSTEYLQLSLTLVRVRTHQDRQRPPRLHRPRTHEHGRSRRRGRRDCRAARQAVSRRSG